jgi:hypothetical protein
MSVSDDCQVGGRHGIAAESARRRVHHQPPSPSRAHISGSHNAGPGRTVRPAGVLVQVQRLVTRTAAVTVNTESRPISHPAARHRSRPGPPGTDDRDPWHNVKFELSHGGCRVAAAAVASAVTRTVTVTVALRRPGSRVSGRPAGPARGCRLRVPSPFHLVRVTGTGREPTPRRRDPGRNACRAGTMVRP